MMLSGVGHDPRSRTEASGLVREFMRRKAMSEAGFATDMGKLPAWKVEVFAAIASKVADHYEKERKKRKVR